MVGGGGREGLLGETGEKRLAVLEEVYWEILVKV